MSEPAPAGTVVGGYRWDGAEWTPVAGIVVDGYRWDGSDWVPEPGVAINGYRWDGAQWAPVPGAVVGGYRWDGTAWVPEPGAALTATRPGGSPALVEPTGAWARPAAAPPPPLQRRPAFWVLAAVVVGLVAMALNWSAPEPGERTPSAPPPNSSVSFLVPDTGGQGQWIEVGTGPEAVTVDPATGATYVANAGGDDDFSISVVDIGASRVYREDHPLGYAQPVGLAFDGATGTLFVVHPGSGSSTIAATDAKTFEVLHTITVHGDSAGVALAEDGRRLYVACYESSSLLIVDAQTGRTLKTLSLGAKVDGVAIDPATNRLYFGVEEPNSARYRIAVVDTRTDKVTRSIAVSHQPLALAIGRSSRLWVSDPNEGGLFEIDPDTGEEVGSIEAGHNVLGIAADLDRDRLFATDYSANRLYVFPLG